MSAMRAEDALEQPDLVITEGEPPIPSRELRLGIVLHGGVSLAVYMYGVVYELWRLVKASRGVEENAYTPILRDTGYSATVDIISGASAGGLNGVLLAKALVEGGDLDLVRRVWLDDAGLETLLQSPREKAPRSLLRSEYFHDKITEALHQMDKRKASPRLVDTLDLFIATTRLEKATKVLIDSWGKEIEVGDYRRSFQLKFRRKGFNPADENLGYERNDFSASANDRLADLARATSAFPGAFEPQELKREVLGDFFGPMRPMHMPQTVGS